MKEKVILGIILILIISITYNEELFTIYNKSLSAVHKESYESPEESVNQFLEASKIIDISEGKELIAKYNWRVSEMEIPEILSYKKLYGGSFDTDNLEIKGYKQLLNIQVTSKHGIKLNKKYRINKISAKDEKNYTKQFNAISKSN